MSDNGNGAYDCAPRYIAYVYPGWHRDPYRPGVDEWNLLETFRPYFTGHLPPPRPLAGAYDDTDRETVAAQIDLALSMGIEGFTFFAYFGSREFVMQAPMKLAFETSAEANGEFCVGATLCVRLPHDRFPVPARDELTMPARSTVTVGASLEDTPIELLTLRDLETLMGDNAAEWIEIALGQARGPRTRGPRSPSSTGRKDA